MNQGKAYAFLFGQCTTGLQHRIEAKAKYAAEIKGNPIRLLEAIKENSLSFNDKKKADIVIIDAMMNLMTTRQRDNVLTHDEPTLTNTVCVHALDCLFLHAVHMKQGGYECYHIPIHQIII